MGAEPDRRIVVGLQQVPDLKSMRIQEILDEENEDRQTIVDLRNQLEEAHTALIHHDDKLRKRNDEITGLKRTIIEKDTKIIGLQEELATREAAGIPRDPDGHYQALGLHPMFADGLTKGQAREIVNRAWKSYSMIFHTDHAGELERMKKINAAHDHFAPRPNQDNALAIRVEEENYSFGLGRIAGLPPKTLAELKRISDRLKDPEKAAFMKNHGFKQSNGAVFWGIPGTGKSLACEALAEEAGCERIELKLDEYMTKWMHESASMLGEKLREVKEAAAGKERPLIVQIDEADTILIPVRTDLGESHDRAEIRAVLLREFQEPSNVFFILTTNLDPRDTQKADPAIVRNQRLGHLISFTLPNEEGRKEIFAREIRKRSDTDARWEEINFTILANLTKGFAPSDIQAVLAVAAERKYNSDTQSIVVNQQDLEEAVNIVRLGKQNEEEE